MIYLYQEASLRLLAMHGFLFDLSRNATEAAINFAFHFLAQGASMDILSYSSIHVVRSKEKQLELDAL
jgi:hypothetical protein